MKLHVPPKLSEKQMIDHERETFKKEFNNREGMFFKTYDNSLLRIGRKGNYFIEGNYKQLDKINIKTILSCTNYLTFLVIVDSINYLEGTFNFDAMPSDIDGNENQKIIFFIPRNTPENSIEFDLIKNHEINHIRVEELLKNKEGELNYFYSEVLADVLLISELTDNDMIQCKLADIKSLINSPKTPVYYNKYLNVIKKLIENKNPKIIANEIIEAAKNFKFNQETIEDFEKEIYTLIN